MSKRKYVLRLVDGDMLTGIESDEIALDNFKAGSFDLSLAWSQILHGFRDDRQICIRLSGIHLEYIFVVNQLLSNTFYEISGKEY